MGDCGAFSYVKEEYPPYTIPEVVEYYSECGFDLGVSIDHVILGYDEKLDKQGGVPEEWQRRYAITLQLAEEFRNYCDKNRVSFYPIGIAQGWSPGSYRKAVRRLVDMGYDYVALGGMVPLKVPQIHRVLQAIRKEIPLSVRLHIFGFTKADNITEFTEYGIESFDSTSPLLRAFKDHARNYLGSSGWYTAIRIPFADESRLFKAQILAGMKEQRQLRRLEQQALDSIRSYSRSMADIDETLAALLSYGDEYGSRVSAELYRKTLVDQPWKSCSCKVCTEAGVEVVIFRGSNRNRRRGFHNLWEFYRQLKLLNSRIEKTRRN